ncbi:MAG: arylsulfatase [Planctomycetaceae bacterium]|nr:arylsulfatase [Planctomycetaceae bacterium]
MRVAASFAIAVFTVSAASADVAQRPNILYIMADDLGVYDVGAYGQPLIKTPNIDQLAREGTRFTQAYAGASVCAPSRSVLVTGLHTGHTRVRGNHSRHGGVIGESGEKGRVPLRDEDVTVAEVLREAGYVNGITGKWGLGEGHTSGVPNRQGFDQWFGYLNQDQAHSYYQSSVWLNEEKFDLVGNSNGQRQQYTHDLFTGFALNFIRANKDRPFFLYVPYTIPHAKHEVPDRGEYETRDWPREAREYAAMTSRMDDHIGLILKLIDEEGLRDNTVVFFCSDNGGPAPFNEVFHSNGELRGRKGQLFEGGIRVPMIVRWPHKVAAGAVSDVPWYFADFLPTAAALAGATPPDNTDGISILPTLLGEHQDELVNRFLYWEQTSQGFQQAVRWRHWKAIRTGLEGELELYDLSDDPTESHNVAAQHADVVAHILDYLTTARVESHDWPAAPVN